MILLNFFRRKRNFFHPARVSDVGQHTTGWPPSVRLAGFPGNGKTKGGGKTWPASLFINTYFTKGFNDFLPPAVTVCAFVPTIF
jgi:hypothetical protein